MDDTNDTPASSAWTEQNRIHCNDHEGDAEKRSAPLHTPISQAKQHNPHQRSFGVESTASRINYGATLLVNRAELHRQVTHNSNTLLSTNSEIYNRYNITPESLNLSQWLTAPSPKNRSTTSLVASAPRRATRGRPPSLNSTFPCNVCGKYYSRKDNLRAHQRLHSGEMPYKCMECGKLFRWQSALQSHTDSPNCPGNSEIEPRSRYPKSGDPSSSNISSDQNAAFLRKDCAMNFAEVLDEEQPNERRPNLSQVKMTSFRERDHSRSSCSFGSHDMQLSFNATDDPSPSPSISFTIDGLQVNIPYRETNSPHVTQNSSGKEQCEQLNHTHRDSEIFKHEDRTAGETSEDELTF